MRRAEPGARELEKFSRDLEHGTAGNLGGETEFGHVVAELLPLLGGPDLDQIPRRIERDIVVEHADPQRRQRQQVRQRPESAPRISR